MTEAVSHTPPPPAAAPDGTAAEPPARGFLLCYALSFIVALLAVYAVNIAGNATGLFPSPWRPGASERGWKTRRFDELVKAGRAPKVLITGSSRVMQIQPPYVAALTGKPVFNYGVSVGGPIDAIAELRHAVEMGATPELLIVGVDEQALSDIPNVFVLQNASNWGLFHNLPLRNELVIGGRVLGAINAETTFDSVQSLSAPLPPPDPKANPAFMLLGDGYLIYRHRVRQKVAGTYDLNFIVEREAHGFHRNVPAGAWNVTDHKVALFRDLLALARSHGVQVHVMLLPLHPHYDAMIATKPMMRERATLAPLLASLCAASGAAFHDFSSLASYGGDPDEFWDGMHQTPENLRRMVNVVFGLPPDKVVAVVPSDVELLEHPPAVTSLTTR